MLASNFFHRLYAPPGEYIKDHCFIFYNNLWHMFSISGNTGEEMTTTAGNEEKFSHSVSRDLGGWEFVDHCLEKGAPGSFDADMIWAPFVIRKDGYFYMFYTGCVQPCRDSYNWVKGASRKTGLAVSCDLYKWEKQARPLEIAGKDPHVIKDPESGQWILYVANFKFEGLTGWRSDDLLNWHDPSPVFNNAPRKYVSRNIYESPFVLHYPEWDKYLMFLNLGYSVSDNPLKFQDFSEYKCDLPCAPDEWVENQKWFHPQIGFAGEIIKSGNQYYRSSCFGPRNRWKLKFFRIRFEKDYTISMEKTRFRNLELDSRLRGNDRSKKQLKS